MRAYIANFRPVPLLLASFFLSVAAGSLLFAFLGERERRPDPLPQANERWKKEIHELGARDAYKKMIEESATLTPQEQHINAHIFGGALYDTQGENGLSVCDQTFSFGCFHEFLGRAIASLGPSSIERLNEHCFDDLVISPLSCQHGIGHGALAFAGYEEDGLHYALPVCRDLPYADPIGGCYGGAFMEYNMRTMLGAESTFRAPPQGGDLVAECASLDPEYRSACVYWAPQWWNAVLQSRVVSLDESFVRMGELCSDERILTERRDCFEGIGNITPPTADFSAQKSARLCDLTSRNAEERLFCRSTAANSLYTGGAGKIGDALGVCAGLEGAHYSYCAAYARNEANAVERPSVPGSL